MKTNIKPNNPVFTHEGGPSSNISPIQRLKRLSMACMLWEDTFYVDGKTIADQIRDVCSKVDGDKIVEVALEAHEKGLLRHLPLWLILQALKKKAKCADAIYQICSRPDQMTELLSLYWKDGKKSIPAQMKKGLAKAFTRFDRFQLSKYNRNDPKVPIKFRDILFLCHAKPKNEQQDKDWKDLIDGKLEAPDTWEVRLTRGEDKKESFQELLEKGKMGKLAIVRNLRNMHQSGVPKDLVEREIMKKARPILPFQFIAAAKACPQWEAIVDKAMVASLQEKEKLDGPTILLVDISSSMSQAISSKSTLNRLDAACGIAILLREVCHDVFITTFSEKLALVPPRHGMALKDAIYNSQPHAGTYLGHALNYFLNNNPFAPLKAKRIIVITDEQTADYVPMMPFDHNYIVNVSCYENGIKNKGSWLTINGFSEAIADYIREIEKDDN